eukprot:1066012-Heterocapsa_arctica.AAC.1
MLVERVQRHMMRTHIVYMCNQVVRKDIESSDKVGGEVEGKKGRPCIRPEQRGLMFRRMVNTSTVWDVER